MSHVDEGTLHAWLDGALDALPAEQGAQVREHMAACAECRARLEEERAIRQEAADILSSAAPGAFDPPAFEELRARARARGGPSRASGRLYRLGWAASVVLAVGAGWMLHDASVPDFGGGEALERERVVSPGAGAATSQGEARVAAPAPRAKSEVTNADPGATPGEADAPVAPGALVAAESARADAPLADDLSPLSIPRPGESVLPTSLALGDRALAAVLPYPRFDTLAFPRSAMEAKEAVAVADTRRRTSDAPVASDALTGVGAVRSGASTPKLSSVLQPAASRPDVAATEAGASRSGFVSDAGLVREDPRSFLVPGLTVISIDPLDGEGLPGATRLRQRMTDGDTLEVVRLPAGLSPSALAPVEGDGRTELVLPRGGGWLVVRAHADRDALRELVRTMGGGG